MQHDRTPRNLRRERLLGFLSRQARKGAIAEYALLAALIMGLGAVAVSQLGREVRDTTRDVGLVVERAGDVLEGDDVDLRFMPGARPIPRPGDNFAIAIDETPFSPIFAFAPFAASRDERVALVDPGAVRTSDLVWSVSGGNFPPGFVLAPDGTLTGPATAAGIFTFEVAARIGSGPRMHRQTATLSLTAAMPQAIGLVVASDFSPSDVIAGGRPVTIPVRVTGDLLGQPVFSIEDAQGHPVGAIQATLVLVESSGQDHLLVWTPPVPDGSQNVSPRLVVRDAVSRPGGESAIVLPDVEIAEPIVVTRLEGAIAASFGASSSFVSDGVETDVAVGDVMVDVLRVSGGLRPYAFELTVEGVAGETAPALADFAVETIASDETGDVVRIVWFPAQPARGDIVLSVRDGRGVDNRMTRPVRAGPDPVNPAFPFTTTIFPIAGAPEPTVRVIITPLDPNLGLSSGSFPDVRIPGWSGNLVTFTSDGANVTDVSLSLFADDDLLIFDFVPAPGQTYTAGRRVVSRQALVDAPPPFAWYGTSWSGCSAQPFWSDWGSWSSGCSSICGPGAQTSSRTCENRIGTQTRSVSCRRLASDAFVSSVFCSHLPHPGTSQQCLGACANDAEGGATRTRACQSMPCFSWDAGAWSACSANPTPGAWGAWSTCSASCGGGSQTRTRSCTNTTGSRTRSVVCRDHTGAIAPDSSCEAFATGSRPVATETCSGTCSEPLSESQACNTQSCFVWQTGSWSACSAPTPTPSAWSSWSTCSASCGGGTQTRTRTCSSTSGTQTRSVTCLNTATGQTVANANCPGPAPVASQTCTQSCTAHLSESQACNTQACCTWQNVLVGQHTCTVYTSGPCAGGCGGSGGCPSTWTLWGRVTSTSQVCGSVPAGPTCVNYFELQCR